MHDRELLMTNDKGGKQCDLVPSARTESSVQQSRSFLRNFCMYYENKKQITVFVIVVRESRMRTKSVNYVRKQ